MCDYSLMGLPNRLATEGEELVTYRFLAGTIGLASAADVRKITETLPIARTGFWAAARELFCPHSKTKVRAVCVPFGACLRLEDVPKRLRHRLDIGMIQEVTFAQITAMANHYRDAVRFSNGTEVLLQKLVEGQRGRLT